ncbi:MAG TPA: hypothetical protein VJP78_16100 [Thermoleophilia bacterium]|nr:hypothetical protein [Thermoleophilia bacterium]
MATQPIIKTSRSATDNTSDNLIPKVTMNTSTGTEGHGSTAVCAAKAFVRTPWLLTILSASGLCLAYLVGVLVNWGDAADRSLYANLGMIPIGLLATILARAASKAQSSRRVQWAWRLLGAGLACFLAGDVLFFVYQNVLGTSPFPSLADAGYITYYLLIFAGLLWFPNLAGGQRRRIIPFIGASVAVVAVAAVILNFILLPTIQDGGESLFAYSLSLGYPLGDLLLLLGIAWMFLRTRPGRRLSIALFTAGLIMGLVADVLYGYQSIQGTFQSGGLSDAGYMLSWALFAWAGYMEVVRNQCDET